MGKSVPETLIMQIEQDKKNEIEQDTFNNFNTLNHTQEAPIVNKNIQYIQSPFNNNIQQRQIQNIKHQAHTPTPPHKYSPQYAAYVGAQSRAKASARIKLGGVF